MENISGIPDPIYHLCRIKAFRFIPLYLYDHPKASDYEVLFNVRMEVGAEYEPGPGVWRRMWPLLKEEIKKARKLSVNHGSSYQSLDGDHYRNATDEEKAALIKGTGLKGDNS